MRLPSPEQTLHQRTLEASTPSPISRFRSCVPAPANLLTTVNIRVSSLSGLSLFKFGNSERSVDESSALPRSCRSLSGSGPLAPMVRRQSRFCTYQRLVSNNKRLRQQQETLGLDFAVREHFLEFAFRDPSDVVFITAFPK